MEVVNTPPKTKIRFLNQHAPDFFTTLRKKVDIYFSENQVPKHGNYKMFLKTLVMFSLYLIPFLLILTNWLTVWQALLCVVVMGIGKSGIGLAVMHDALHGSYAKQTWVNQLMGASIYFIGGNAFCWKTQHNVLHHTYTNIYDHDEDIETKFILRLSPYAELKPYHKYQYLYALPLYFLMTISLFVKDFIKVFRYHRENLNTKTSFGYELTVLLITKVSYFLVFFALPLWLTDFTWWQVALGLFIVHAIAGMALSLIFQMAHLIEETEHPPLNDEGNIENSWAIHQLMTTANFANSNQWLTWFVGGLNYQVEHHLFPNICHIHYPAIAPIVRETAQAYGLPYHAHPTFGSALVSHFNSLKHLGHHQAGALQHSA